MERKFLKDLGLADDAVDKVMAENGKDIETHKAASTTAQTTITDLQKQISERDKQIEGLKKVDPEKLQAEITRLQGENTAAQQKYQDDLKQARLTAALDLSITKAKGKNATAIKALIDTAKLAVKDDGSVDGLDGIIEGLKKSDAYLFDQVTTTQKGSGNPGGAGGDPNPNNQQPASLADAVQQFYSGQK